MDIESGCQTQIKLSTSRDVIFKESVPTFNFDITIRNDQLSNQTEEYEDTEDIEETTTDNQELGGRGLRDQSKILKPHRYRDAEINIAEGLELLSNGIPKCTVLEGSNA